MITVSIAVTARHVQSKSSASIRQLLGGLLALCTVALLVQPASCSAHSQIVQFLDTLPQLNASSTAADVQPLNLIIVLRVSLLLPRCFLRLKEAHSLTESGQIVGQPTRQKLLHSLPYLYKLCTQA